MKLEKANSASSLYDNYWEFWNKRGEFGRLKRPVVRWFQSFGLNPIERVYFDFVSQSHSILDFGAGDLSIKRKFIEAGYRGKYSTCDVSEEFSYDFHSIDEVVKSGNRFDAILVLEVIEHLQLHEFEAFLPKVIGLLKSRGRLVLSTPNPQSIHGVWSTDIGHVKAYPQADLWAMLTLRGFKCTPYRIVWTSEHPTLKETMRFQIARVLTHFLGVDYAVGTALVCELS